MTTNREFLALIEQRQTDNEFHAAFDHELRSALVRSDEHFHMVDEGSLTEHVEFIAQ